MSNIYQRVRKAQAKLEAARKAAEYKAGESLRRSRAARLAADIRREARDEAIIRGDVMPRNDREDDLQWRALFGVETEDELYREESC